MEYNLIIVIVTLFGNHRLNHPTVDLSIDTDAAATAQGCRPCAVGRPSEYSARKARSWLGRQFHPKCLDTEDIAYIVHFSNVVKVDKLLFEQAGSRIII